MYFLLILVFVKIENLTFYFLVCYTTICIEMKYIIIIGKGNSGKSTTIDAICKRLKPDEIFLLNSDKFLNVPIDSVIHNGTYLLRVKSKSILIVAGAPTEQRIRITILIEICIKMSIKIDFALIAMRSYERTIGYNTKNELEIFGECILMRKIEKVIGDDFRQSLIWNNRVNEIFNLINKNL